MRSRKDGLRKHALASAGARLREHLRTTWRRLRQWLRPSRSSSWSPVQFRGWPADPELWETWAFGLLVLFLLLEQHLAGGLP